MSVCQLRGGGGFNIHFVFSLLHIADFLALHLAIAAKQHTKLDLHNTKNTIGVQQIVYEALCNCAMGYFTSIFVGVEMAQMVKALV